MIIWDQVSDENTSTFNLKISKNNAVKEANTRKENKNNKIT